MGPQVTAVYDGFNKRLQASICILCDCNADMASVQDCQSSFLNCQGVESREGMELASQVGGLIMIRWVAGMMDALRQLIALRYDIETHAQTDLAQAVAQNRSSDWSPLSSFVHNSQLSSCTGTHSWCR